MLFWKRLAEFIRAIQVWTTTCRRQVFEHFLPDRIRKPGNTGFACRCWQTWRYKAAVKVLSFTYILIVLDDLNHDQTWIPFKMVEKGDLDSRAHCLAKAMLFWKRLARIINQGNSSLDYYMPTPSVCFCQIHQKASGYASWLHAVADELGDTKAAVESLIFPATYNSFGLIWDHDQTWILSKWWERGDLNSPTPAFAKSNALLKTIGKKYYIQGEIQVWTTTCRRQVFASARYIRKPG